MQLKNATYLMRGFRRVLGVVDPGGVERLGETLHAIIDIWARPEWALPCGEILGGGVGAEAAVAGQYSCVQLFNPGISRHLVISEQVSVQQSSRVYVMQGGVPALAALSDCGPRDGRLPFNVGGLRINAQVRDGTLPNLNQLYLIQELPAAGVYEVELVLPPACGCIVIPRSGVNLDCGAAYFWREHYILPGESAQEMT